MDLTEFFSGEGPLPAVLPGYAPRRGQVELARAVADTFSRGGVLLAEAGTGTGKTLAYLLPAVLAHRKVVVSTATKTLQAQIVHKDVPLLAAALGRTIAAVQLKGRENYLCLRRFERFRARPLFRFAAEAGPYERMSAWAGATQTGDRADLTGVPEDYAPWREVCSTTDTCWGGKCPRQEDCHFLRHRRAAQKAQVVVVNHHLFFADLAVRAASDAEVIPRYGAVVFDEAHHLESVATQYFGTRVSSFRLAELLRDAGRQAPARAASAKRGRTRAKAPQPPDREGALLDAVAEAGDGLWRALPRADSPLRLRGALPAAGAAGLAALLDALGRWSDHLAPREAASQESENLARRVKDLIADLSVFAAPPHAGEVRWLEARGRGVFLHAAPVEVGPALGGELFGGRTPVVLTSATLRVGGSFDYLAGRLGVTADRRELTVESPFDHARQGLLYVPAGVPEPNDPSFAAAAAREIRDILSASQGRAFCLFTSHRVLQAVAAALRGTLPYRLLVQGEEPREALLAEFQRDVHSVLLGAQAFWEGVDVPGEALSAVIIDRLPFASPGDPLVEARVEALRNRGEAPFSAYQLPAAAMALRQGVGRLLRRVEDRGVVAVLDRRFVEASYAAYLRRSLPPFPLTRDPGRVRAFFGEP